MVTIVINGKQVRANEGEMLLAVIRREGIDIPSTCHHEAVEPYGACRLCTVEITKDSWKGWKNYVTSCLYPVEDGLIVQTHSEKVIDLRKTLLDLYLARSPKAELIQNMAAEYGVLKTSFEEVPDGNDCILCGLCTRICDAMGFHAISSVNRGHGKEIAPPLWEVPPDCVGCLSCAENCPTNFIKFKKDGPTLEIWGKTFERVQTKSGEYTITKDFAKALQDRREIPAEYFEEDDTSHRNTTAKTMGRIANWTREAKA